jgi:U1 small nuclear ribonucleoprotein
MTAEPYKTLFVARLNWEVTDTDLKDEFEYYGPVSKVRIVKNKKTDKSRGYGFLEFENSRDLKEAYKDADGRKINNRRILVDVERGRTVKNWFPKRLGGGLGGTRIGAEEVNQKFSGM